MTKDVLGVKIDDLTMPEALELVFSWLLEPRTSNLEPRYIVTPNPEFIMSAQKDPEFLEILNKADLSIPDGAGLRLGGVTNVVPGVDFMEALCRKASQDGWSVGFVGGQDSVSKKCAEALKGRLRALKVNFSESGGEVLYSGVTTQDLSKLPPTDIVFVALGHIKQEKWIVRHMSTVPAKVLMGVGGAFDYLAGVVPRAPLWMRQLGLEWLFRLVIQPWRISRQLRLIEFVYRIILSR